MTIQELIEQLKDFPPDAVVFINSGGEHFHALEDRAGFVYALEGGLHLDTGALLGPKEHVCLEGTGIHAVSKSWKQSE